jgi:YHS domain-containing protein
MNQIRIEESILERRIAMIIKMLFILIPLVIFIILPALHIRNIIKRTAKNFSEAHAGKDKAAGANSEGYIQMVKDEVCGKFVLAEKSLCYTAGGTTHYFCCESCKEKYMNMHS